MSDAPSPPASPGAVLIQLQAEDVVLDQLAYRRQHLPAKVALVELARRAEALVRALDAVNAERTVLMDRQDALEHEIAEADGRLSSLDARASSGEVASFRDQEAIATEMGSINRRKRELEDEELEIMEALEPHDAALASVVAEQESVEIERATTARQVALEEAEVDAEVTVVAARRATLAAEVPAPLIAEYEKLRGRFGGIGVAHVVHGSCSGCNLALSATELDRLRHLDGGSLEHCEQCGRLLVL